MLLSDSAKLVVTVGDGRGLGTYGACMEDAEDVEGIVSYGLLL